MGKKVVVTVMSAAGKTFARLESRSCDAFVTTRRQKIKSLVLGCGGSRQQTVTGGQLMSDLATVKRHSFQLPSRDIGEAWMLSIEAENAK
jgi:hypothetical protein